MKTVIVRNFVAGSLISIFCLIPAMVMAGSDSEEYTVKKHDTLWDISAQKLKDPFLWKKLWHENQSLINNPDLIFPGQKLTIPGEAVSGERAVGRSEQQGGNKETAAGSSELRVKRFGRKITPEKMSEEEAEKIAGYNAVSLVSREMLISSGAIVDEVPDVGTISGSPLRKTIMGQGDDVYILTDMPAAKGAMFYVYGGPDRINHPVTGRHIGDLVRIKGIIEVVGEEGGNKKAKILQSFEDIAVDDLLGQYYLVVPVKLVERRPAGVSGYIVKLKDDKVIAAGGNIVYLDKGTGDGVAVGDMFDINSGEKPSIPVGGIQVISVRTHTSTALIKTARDAIQPGDVFGN